MEDFNILSSHLPEYASNAAPISSLAFPKFIVSNSCSLISPLMCSERFYRRASTSTVLVEYMYRVPKLS